MPLVKKILNRLNGLYYPQEYICLAKESFSHPLHVYLVSGNRVVKDITNHHLFTGYKPLIFTLPSLNEINLPGTQSFVTIFTPDHLQPNDLIRERDATAVLSLQKIHQQDAGGNTICYFKGIKGKHHFINSFHQLILQWQNRLFNKRPGNVFLPGNLYKQVQIAYSVPRNISLITIKQGELFNLFPTDLHGQIVDSHYIISLRQGGKASQQVEQAKKILITEVNSSFYKTAYALGKNHMQAPKAMKQFPFSDSFSDKFHLPLPQSATLFRELELQQSFDYGIHRFFLFSIRHWRQVEHKPHTLAHIHNVYATWRYYKAIPGNFLF